MTILAIDQGTTSTRAFAVSQNGTTTIASITHRQSYPKQGWVEHDGEELLANVKACILAAHDFGVAAVGIDNQGESCLGWDAATGEPVGPVIVWQDNRTSDDCARLQSDGVAELVRERASLPLDPYFSASKLRWIVENNRVASDLASKGRLRLGTTDAFFRDRLTGRFETDVSTASRTSLMNLSTCQWDPELCRVFGVPIDALPQITATTGDLGMIGDIRLTASVVDQQAALYGNGCRNVGDTKITFGTGAFALTLSGALTSVQGPLPTIAWQLGNASPVYALDGGVYSASAAINWARGLGLFQEWSEINQFDLAPAIARGLAFVPALAGLACPYWDRRAKGTWMGLTLDTSSRDMAQAVLEGVAFRMAEVIESLKSAVEINAVISVDGGMSANPWFCQFLADALGQSIRISDEPELTAIGTASLAAHGADIELLHRATGRLIAPCPQPAEWRTRFDAARQAVQSFGAA